ncbi:hypothetical protein Cob_v002281 [Colletotrichum orbiculare MAFF 240422]|uniref:Uncharacterized protein n=1 Tax=Colletotrichum orbiculare (strain 104-T / ATCC 96160 / CBS 514.97 / LARS 414 / MAFF 240422) TaxID=1213857 RepID=A0A484G386_COLOR|nr:hypothetical protein Cob_v002281 [Colletotrichum orbiculare MAFF 240422]
MCPKEELRGPKRPGVNLVRGTDSGRRLVISAPCTPVSGGRAWMLGTNISSHVQGYRSRLQYRPQTVLHCMLHLASAILLRVVVDLLFLLLRGSCEAGSFASWGGGFATKIPGVNPQKQ